jgi:malonyl CoA-acyl carrier protein transacylase
MIQRLVEARQLVRAGIRVVDRSSYNANRSLVVSGMPILVIARRQSR